MSSSYYYRGRDRNHPEESIDPFFGEEDESFESLGGQYGRQYGQYGQKGQYGQYGQQGQHGRKSQGRHRHQFPTIRMTRSEREYKIYCDVPGVSKSDLKVELCSESQYQKELCISGVRRFGDRMSSSERRGSINVERTSELGSSQSGSQQGSSQLGLQQGSQQYHGQSGMGLGSERRNIGIERGGQEENVGTSSHLGSTSSGTSDFSQQQGLGRGSNLGVQRGSQQSADRSDFVDPSHMGTWPGSSERSRTERGSTSTGSSGITQGSSVHSQQSGQESSEVTGDRSSDQSSDRREGQSVMQGIAQTVKSIFTGGKSDTTGTDHGQDPDKYIGSERGYGMEHDRTAGVIPTGGLSSERSSGQGISSTSQSYQGGLGTQSSGQGISSTSQSYQGGLGTQSSGQSYQGGLGTQSSGFGQGQEKSFGQGYERDRDRDQGSGEEEFRFSRTINLPNDADVRSIKAKLENGVLCLCMPRLQGSGRSSINVD